MINIKNSMFFVFCFLFFVCFQKGLAQENDELASNSSWYLYKISKYNLFGESDSTDVDRIKKLYGDVEFHINDKKLTIKNNLLETPIVCDMNYMKAKETMLSYFLSQKTVDLYNELITREGIGLSKSIYIYYPLKPSDTCPSAYNEPIEYNGYLLLNIDNYIVFFSKDKKKKKEKKEDFSYFCKNENPGGIYNGESKYICSFNGYNLFESYYKLIYIAKLDKYLRREIPMSNAKYSIDNANVTYEWINKWELKIDIISDEQTEVYLINDMNNNNTKVKITVITGY